MSDRDANFSPETVEIIRARAGYRCSFPECDEATIGPGAGPYDVEKKGVAAHIFSASRGSRGPRGTGGLSPTDRSKATNGIWLCQDHARLIDSDKGKNYPASSLQSWKALHEDRIAHELRKVPVLRQGWLERITIEASPLFSSGQSIVLGKVTLLIGANGTGKTALCEWLGSCVGHVDHLVRWRGRNQRIQDIRLRITLRSPEKAEFEMRFCGQDVAFASDGRSALDLAHAIRMVYILGDMETNYREDDAEYLSRLWGIHLYQVSDVISALSSSKYGFVRSAELRHDLDDEEMEDSEAVPERVRRLRRGRKPVQLHVKIGDHQDTIPFSGLSGRERSQLIVSGAIVIAERYSRHLNTVLILELAGHLLPDGLLSIYAEKFQNSDFRFQTILVSHSDRPNVDWTGWSVARLVGRPPQVSIEQETIDD